LSTSETRRMDLSKLLLNALGMQDDDVKIEAFFLNGSQFFITTVATPWLEKCHTIFGEVVDQIEKITIER
jgi:hypothetical protein